MSAAAGPQPALPPFPWDAALAFGLGRLRLSPDAFWSMTPRELAAAAGLLLPGRGELQRADLEALMRAFPDRADGFDLHDPYHEG